MTSNTGRPDLARAHTYICMILLALGALGACSKGGQEAAPPPTPVGVIEVQPEALELPLTYFAKTAGSREVEVRARVSGILLERRYHEGGPVRQGQLMFKLDPERYRAAAQQQQAQLGVEQAKLDDAKRQYQRVAKLVEGKLVSQQQLDTAQSTLEIAQASVRSAEAALKSAQIDLDYTEVRAPISGLTSKEVRSEGSLITAGTDSSLLTRIVQIDPLYIDFSVPQSEASLVRSRLSGGARSGVEAQIELDGGGEAKERAPLAFLDNAVQSDSGTVSARAILPNREEKILPGQFVRLHLGGVALKDVIAVPRRAVMSGPQGNFVWVANAKNTAEMRPVKFGRTVGQRVVIESGLQAGDRVVVDGVMKVRPDAQLAATSVNAEATASTDKGAAASP
jgi:membrane fusion protein, multidrug efflux system